ncbi:MAG: type II toxin-antitoxin system PemK/MazF family toxin [Sellimonas intestinalis]
MEAITKGKDVLFRTYYYKKQCTAQTEIHIFDVYMADLPELTDDRDKHIQQYRRPCVVISNDKCNSSSPNVSIIPITSQTKKVIYSCNSQSKMVSDGIRDESGLYKPSILLVEAETSISKERLVWKMGHISSAYLIRAIYQAQDIHHGRLPV